MANITQTAKSEQPNRKRISKKDTGKVVSLPSKDRSSAPSEVTESPTSEPPAEKIMSESGAPDAPTREWAAGYSDAEILERMFASKNGQMLKALWAGQWRDFYRSNLQAEKKLVSNLGFWLGRDAVRIERMLRSRGLKYEKWYERQPDGKSYIAALIETVLSKQKEFYHPPRKQKKNQGSCPDPHGGSKSDKSAKDEEDDKGLYVSELGNKILDEAAFTRDAGGKLYLFEGGVYRPTGERYVNRRVKELVIEYGKEKKWSTSLASQCSGWILADAVDLWEQPPVDRINLLNGHP